jgi:dimethylargininase
VIVPIAFVREVASTFAHCVTVHPPNPPLDADVARQQHSEYAAALAAGGFEVRVVAADDRFPDCCFIEDTAIVVDGAALMARPGHPSRTGELAAVADALNAVAGVEEVDEPATLDGGDVLQVGGRVFVGVGGRTNRQGFERVSAFAGNRGRTVTPVSARGVLHLKSAATALDDETVLVHPGAVPVDAFTGLRVAEAPAGDPESANVVRLADGSLLVAAHHGPTAGLLDSMGYRVVTVDAGEFARADGGLTCLSIRVRRPGGPA